MLRQRAYPFSALDAYSPSSLNRNHKWQCRKRLLRVKPIVKILAMASASYRTISVSLPSELADQIERIAKNQSKTTSELLEEALRSYRLEQVSEALQASQEEFRRNNPMNYTEADVERLIDEYRAEEAAANKAQ